MDKKTLKKQLTARGFDITLNRIKKQDVENFYFSSHQTRKESTGSMNKQAAKIFIEKELDDLAVDKDCDAWKQVFDTAIEASEIMTKEELRKYIEEYLDTLPKGCF